MTVTYVDAEDRYTEFNRALRDRLRASGAKLVDRAGEATAVVKIIKDESGQRVLSVSARNTPEEYEVFYAVEYSVASGGTELIPPQRLELTRDYSYDTAAVLAKQREQAVLREALAQDLASLVLRRLASLVSDATSVASRPAPPAKAGQVLWLTIGVTLLLIAACHGGAADDLQRTAGGTQFLFRYPPSARDARSGPHRVLFAAGC